MPRKIETTQDRETVREYGRAWYRKNAPNVIKHKDARRDEIQKWFLEYKARLKCEHCGESDLIVLDFHHRDPKIKDLSLAQAVHNGWSMNRILQEVNKCDVLCANCHGRFHSSQHK